jgi:hypothetical protein
MAMTRYAMAIVKMPVPPKRSQPLVMNSVIAAIATTPPR